MKKEIEETLQCLIGLDFWGAGRIGELLTFQFGPRQVRTNRHGKTYEVGTYALHVQCAWHLAGDQQILVASGDRHYALKVMGNEMKSYTGELYTWQKNKSTLLDDRLLYFFQQCEIEPVTVQALHADELGSLSIKLSDHHLLTVFPDKSLDEECWRFFRLDSDLPHFVVTGDGIEDQEE